MTQQTATAGSVETTDSVVVPDAASIEARLAQKAEDAARAEKDDMADDELARSENTSGKLRARFKYEHLGLTDAKVAVDGKEVEDCNGFTLEHYAGGLPQVELSFLIVEGNGSVDVSDLDAEVTIKTMAQKFPQPRTSSFPPEALSNRAPRLALMRGGSFDNKLKLIPREKEQPNHFAMCVRYPAVESVVDGVVTVCDEFYQNIHDQTYQRGYDKVLHYQYIGTRAPASYSSEKFWRGALSWEQADAIQAGADVDDVYVRATEAAKVYGDAAQNTEA